MCTRTQKNLIISLLLVYVVSSQVNKERKITLRKIIKSPYLQFCVGLIMLFSSFEGQQGTLYPDLIQFKLRIHHGVNIGGIWQIVQALPNIYDSISWIFSKYLD